MIGVLPDVPAELTLLGCARDSASQGLRNIDVDNILFSVLLDV